VDETAVTASWHPNFANPNGRRCLTVFPSTPVRAFGRRPLPHLPFPLDNSDIAIFARARHALWHGVAAAGLEADDEVLVPAYHCGAEVEALLRAGLSCRFYEISSHLEPSVEELESLLGPRTRALLLIHYLGFPQDASAYWRQWCDARGLLLIENCAQAWQARQGSRPVGSFGQLAIFAPYKIIGLSDGSVLFPGSPRRDGGRSSGRALPRVFARQFAARGVRTLATRFGRGIRWAPHPPNVFELGDPAQPPSPATEFLLCRVADPAIGARRRANFQELLDRLADYVHPAFAELPEGASPFVFPVQTESKPELLAELADRGIDALDLWPSPHPSLPVERFPRSAALRSEIVGLPVHQDLGPDEIDRLVGAFRRPRLQSAPRLDQFNSLEPLREEWDELAERSRNIFGTWEWARTWWSHFGRNRPLHVVACRSADGRVSAILPLHLATDSPIRLLRFVGYGPADQLGPICSPAERTSAARALRAALHDAPFRWDAFFGEQLSAEEGWSTLTGAKVLDRAESPIFRFDGTWDEFVASRSSHFRKFLRWQERKLAREHELRYRIVKDVDSLQPALEKLLALHTARWPQGSRFAAEWAFHREFATHALRRGWLRLWFLELDGEHVAAWYGFRFAGVETYYQAGRHPEWDRSSVGFVLLAHAIREALDDGVTEHRFGRGGEWYKYRFAHEEAGLETIGLSASILGAVALSVAPGFKRWRPRKLEDWYHAKK
jgi:CelD/BcsL family acetyltransferase involved in cellulose biosynthesis